MYNPLTGDGRITGSTASLLGLEKALEENDEAGIRDAISKTGLLYGIIFASPGIPLVYAGDEIGMLNDYSYTRDPDKWDDSRWINRPVHDWKTVSQLKKAKTPASEIYRRIRKLISLRRQLPALADRDNTILHDTGNQHLFVFERESGEADSLLVVANFDSNPQVLNASWLSALGYVENGNYRNLIEGESKSIRSGLLELPPYELLWLVKM
jgi:amylosucrase